MQEPELETIANMITMDELPVEMIHRILAFLSPKEVAQTSVLSKKLFLAWSTFPDFNFDQDTMCRELIDIIGYSKLVEEKFAKSVYANLIRYRKHNLPINKFLFDFTFTSDGELSFLLHNWLGTIVKLGVRQLILKVKPVRSIPSFFYLSPLLLASEQLTSLKILQGDSYTSPPVSYFSSPSIHSTLIKCCNLKSLQLQSVYLDDSVFQKLCSSCPLIEQISLDECVGLESIQVSNLHKLVFFKLTNTPGREKDSLPNKLMRVHVSSPTLKSLIFCQCFSLVDVKIDAPKLLFLMYSANRIPTFSSEFRLSKRFNSRIYIQPNYALDTSFLVNFKDLVSKLSRCESYLGITEYSSRHIWFNIQHLREISSLVCPPKIHKVKLSSSTRSSSYSTLVHGLLSTCHPDILEVMFPSEKRYKFVKFLCKELIVDRTSPNCSPQLRWLRHFLKQVQVEYCSETFHDKWNPFDWKSLVDGSMTPKDCSSIRFILNW